MEFSRQISTADLAPYFLPNLLDDLLRMPGGSNAQRPQAIERKPFMAQERMLCAYVRENTIAHRLSQQQLNRKVIRSTSKIADLACRLGRSLSQRFIEGTSRGRERPSHSITAL